MLVLLNMAKKMQQKNFFLKPIISVELMVLIFAPEDLLTTLFDHCLLKKSFIYFCNSDFFMLNCSPKLHSIVTKSTDIYVNFFIAINKH